MPDAAVMASVAPPDRPAVVSRRHQPLDVLSGVVEYDRFELHAQLIVGICADGIAGYELLLRLRDDGGELVSPCGFIYGAERHGLMGQSTVGFWAGRSSCCTRPLRPGTRSVLSSALRARP